MLVCRISNGIGGGIGFWAKEDSCKVVGRHTTSFQVLESYHCGPDQQRSSLNPLTVYGADRFYYPIDVMSPAGMLNRCLHGRER